MNRTTNLHTVTRKPHPAADAIVASTQNSANTGHTATGRNEVGSKEDPNPSTTVEHTPSSANSRPGPVCGYGEGVFQPVIQGEYDAIPSSILSDPPSDSSATTDRHSSGVNQTLERTDIPTLDEPNPQRQTQNRPMTAPESASVRDDSEMENPSDSVFSIYYQNVRGLRTKTQELRLRLSSCDYDAVVLTETWLRPDISDSELSTDYQIFRCDRNESSSQLSRGGGALIAVKSVHPCSLVSLENCDKLEQVIVRISLENRSLFISGIYVRPLSDPELYKSHAVAIRQISETSLSDDIIMVLGDYNLPHLLWNFDEDMNGYLPSNASTEQEVALTEEMLANGLIQVNSFVNTNGKLLDLAFTTNSDAFDLLEPAVPLLNVDIHHKPFILNLDAHFNVPDRHDALVVFDFKNCDLTALDRTLEAVNWSLVLNGDSVDVITNQFYVKLHAIFHECVPLRRPFSGHSAWKPWWNTELRNLRNKLRKARKRFFISRSEDSRNTLRSIETQYNVLLAASYEEHVQQTQSNLRRNPSNFWKFVKSQRMCNRLPNTVVLNGVNATSPEEIATLFATFFQGVYGASQARPPALSVNDRHEYDLNFPLLHFTPDDVQSVLTNLNASKSPGSDGIPPFFLKYCARSLAFPICCIFNRSLLERTFPSIWKTAAIVPIHKSGSRNHVDNYRGISLLCCISKAFETLVHGALYSVVQPLISEYQHGFVQHRSTSTNLMCYTNTLFREVELRNQVDSVYIDFSKAFDTVPHVRACEKLKAIGLPDWLVDWIRSYLTNRNAFVSLNSTRSESFPITSGVPQGSVLGPLIFVLFVNDLCPRISSFKQLFADDLKIYRVIVSILDCIVLQRDIDNLLLWCSENGMKVNIKKCKIISFSRRSATINHQYTLDAVPLERVSSILDLGVTIDSKLRFNNHVALVTSKAYAVLGFIRRYTWQFSDIYAQKTLYCTLVRSLLEYAAPIWAPFHTSLVLKVERIQRLFIRFTLRNLPWRDPVHLPDYTARCALINLETLDERRKKIQQLFIFDLLGGNIDCPQLLQEIPLYVPPRQLRRSPLIAVPAHRTVYGQNNPLNSCLKAFNDVGVHYDFTISKNVFKNRIKNR